jgi:Protein of unknown function (DUF3037)
MASRYSVIQYVPNPIADERINIGVLVFDEQDVRVRFLQNWERVRNFGMSEDIDLLKNFAHEMQEVTKKGLLFPGDYPSDLPAHERLMKVAYGWMNGIQVTEPLGSLASVDQLLEDMTQTYLLEPLQVVKNEYQISLIYDVLDSILRFSPKKSKKSTHIIKNRDPFSNLRDSTSKFGMTFFEKRFFPNIDDEILRKITEDLSFFDDFHLKIVELYLSRINKNFEKDTNDFWRVIPYFLSFTIFATLSILIMISSILKAATIAFGIYSIAGSLFVSLIGFLVVMNYVRSSKNMMPSKIVLCLHILKEAQLIRDERELLGKNALK